MSYSISSGRKKKELSSFSVILSPQDKSEASARSISQHKRICRTKLIMFLIARPFLPEENSFDRLSFIYDFGNNFAGYKRSIRGAKYAKTRV